MKIFKCPECHRERYYDSTLVMKVCPACQIPMDTVVVKE